MWAGLKNPVPACQVSRPVRGAAARPALCLQPHRARPLGRGEAGGSRVLTAGGGDSKGRGRGESQSVAKWARQLLALTGLKTLKIPNLR